MNGKFDIESITKPVNKNITVVFSPSENVTSYTYQIYKDDIPYKKETTQNQTTITMKETGTYKIDVALTLKNGKEETISSGKYIIDKEAPVITLSKESITTTPTKNKNLITCTANDNYNGSLTNKITDNQNKLDLTKPGNYTYTCTVQDDAGNIASASSNIIVTPHSTYIYIIQFICFIVLICLIFKVIKLFKTFKLEERLGPYTIKPLKDETKTTTEKLRDIYKQFLNIFNGQLKKSVFATKYAKKLEKYTSVSTIHQTGFDILSGKIIFACLLTIMAVVIKAFQFKLLSSSETLLVFILGFFVLDIYLFAKYKVFRWQVENDFTAAITIMNNSFKSGRSITQAMEIVSTEVGGAIGAEFKKMNLELLYGLDIEQVFKRFAKRIDLEEANYLTASLTILNKTGGDIIKVFSSIERSLFDKRKLRLELKSLTSGSRIIVYILLAIPFFFVLVISFISPDYFLPFITTDIGRILLIFMIIYYIIFVVVVRKVMKVVIWCKKQPNSLTKYTVKKN